MKKKLISSSCLILATILFAGCGATQTGNKSAETGSSTSQEAPEELNVMIWDRGDSPSGTTIDNNSTTKFIQESVLADCNVKVNFIPVPRSGSDDKVNVMMAGGTAPDLIYSYSRNLFGDFAKKGGLTDLTPYIEEFGSQIKETLGEDILSVGVLDGKQFAIPAKRNTQKARHLGYIRKDWVEALCMTLPTNKQELIDILYAFKEKDPGNVGANLVPWAMGGNQDTEKYFLNFVGSYVDISNEKDQYIYSNTSKSLHSDAKQGFQIMNKLYNDGIIKKDFAVDTNDDIYKQDITNGYVGFILEDNMRPIDQGWIEALLANDPDAEFVSINILEDPNGKLITPAEPLHGMYIMVPSVSEKKAAAAVKYLNWLANTENAMKVRFTPNYTADENGVPISIDKATLAEEGYATTPNDFTTITQYWAYCGDKDAVVSEWASNYPYLTTEYLSNFYDSATSGLYNEPITQQVLDAETKYLSNIEKLTIELAYTSISTAPENFESVYTSQYNKLNQAGLQELFSERASYYDTNIAK